MLSLFNNVRQHFIITLEKEMEENGTKANTNCHIFQQFKASTSYTLSSSTSEGHL
jgi:hypothetical protein